ncbi:hypothetical protein AUEXF2481DRAFT_602122 [Aureobasidium subglaciale EXF-2481]|uniref:Uncharacterized protein n=1 Tax=Aureobasidium subglaciale (strain EXF-2481) TaxID=1043005 RepID=A0A074YN03_AURSE|nr:uncharacterized protein AUEXF2481DRAFT_602122 [Aureobasidium subglaciale EXF-2481]KEQ97484.1 hypothetical protein AUEXF2481DRAFT_602122 [Aureobasidium subglaciale EXF-2481]
MASINTNRETAGQFSDLKRRTFGVECEFIGLIPTKSPLDATQYTCEILQKKVTLPCKNKCAQGVHSWYLPVQDEASESKAPGTSAFSAWDVQKDISIHLSDGEYLAYRGAEEFTDVGQVELVSRVLNFDSPTPCARGQKYPCTGELFEWEWRDELQAIFGALREGFNRPGYRALINASTGLHVHLDNGSLGFPLDVVKDITGTFIALERCCDSIMPLSRIIGYYKQPLCGMNQKGLTYHPADHEHEFGHGYLESMTETMHRHIDGLITEQ